MNCRERIVGLFTDVADDYRNAHLAETEIHAIGHDIHAFYRLTSDSSKVIHVQGYPGMSNDGNARVYARMMNYEKMLSIRNSGLVSIGNEHDAVIMPFPNFEVGIFIRYDPKILEEKLAENVNELKI